MKEVFIRTDRDGDGYLNQKECHAALKQLGHVLTEKGLERVMKLTDANHDGKVDFMGKFDMLLEVLIS